MVVKLGNTVLADDANNRAQTTRSDDVTAYAWGGPEIDAAEVAFAVQTARPIGAPNASHFARGNAQGSLRFSAATLCQSRAMARRVLVDWPRDVPSSGTLAFGESAASVQDAGAAKLVRLAMRRTGVTVTAEYEILYSPGRS